MAFDLTDKQKKTGVALAAIGLVGGLLVMNYPKRALEIGTGCLGLGIGAYWWLNIKKPSEVSQAVAIATTKETNTSVLRDFAGRLHAAGYTSDAKAVLARASLLDQTASPTSATYVPAIQAASSPILGSNTVMVQRIR